MTNAMASTICTPKLHHPSSSFTTRKPSLYPLSNYAITEHKNVNFMHVKSIPQLGFSPFSQWNGLKHVGISVSQYYVKPVRKGKCKGKGVYASLFGVGAPEALVIGVVALLVFGPKGLAEVARNLGKTSRAFQPTIRELQEVSREFKSTLEREIGLDEVETPAKSSSSSNTNKIDPNGSTSEGKEYSTEDYLKMTEQQLLGGLAKLQKERAETKALSEAQSQDTQEATSEISPSQNSDSNTLQEAASVTPSQNSDSNTLQEATSVTPQSSEKYTPQETASAIPSTAKPGNET